MPISRPATPTRTRSRAPPQVKCPTVLVLGDGDLMTPAAKARPLAAAIAGSRTVVIPNSGHFMIVERPDETLEALKAGV